VKQELTLRINELIIFSPLKQSDNFIFQKH